MFRSASAVFTDPQIATVGARVQDLSHDRPYAEAVQEYADVAYGWALQETTGFCKMYADAAACTLSARTSWAPRPRCSSSR